MLSTRKVQFRSRITLPGNFNDHGEAMSDGNKLLHEQLSAEEQPTENNRRLEVTLLWGDTVVDVRTYAPGQTVTIGPAPSSDFRVYEEGLPETFDLVSDNAIHVPAGSKVAVFRDGHRAQDSGAGRLALGERAQVTVGTIHFILRWIRPPARGKTGFFDSVDLSFTKALAAAFMIQLVLFVGFWITPLNNDSLSEELFKNPQALVRTLIKPPDKKPRDVAGLEQGVKPKDREGKIGKTDAKKPEAAPPKKGAAIVDANKREKDHQKVMRTGLLSGLDGLAGAVSNVFGSSNVGVGLNNALGGLKGGAGAGDVYGMGGVGSRGDSPGGGGTALGIGGFGSHFTGRGRGGYGTIDLGGKGKDVTHVTPGRTIVEGSLSKDVIAGIVHRHENEIRYCYEAELNKHPDLYGKVSVAWTIDGTGDVSEANVNETTMANPDVENCMATKIRRWKFPEPKGGGLVFVTFPWVFRSSAEE